MTAIPGYIGWPQYTEVDYKAPFVTVTPDSSVFGPAGQIMALTLLSEVFQHYAYDEPRKVIAVSFALPTWVGIVLWQKHQIGNAFWGRSRLDLGLCGGLFMQDAQRRNTWEATYNLGGSQALLDLIRETPD